MFKELNSSHFHESLMSYELEWQKISDIFDNCYTIKKFLGLEPMVNKNHWKILEMDGMI